MTDSFITYIEKKEHQNRIVSASITSIIMILFLLLCFFWYAMRPSYVSIGEKEIEMVSGIGEGDGSGATIDHGDGREGNQNVNNGQPAVANPTPAPPSATTPKTAPVPAPSPKINLPAPPPDKAPLAGKDDSPVTTPIKNDKNDKKDDKKTEVKNDSPKTDTKSTTQTTNSNNNSDKSTTTTNTQGGGGSNHGKGGGVGDTGSPTTSALNLEGIQFGAGAGTGGTGGLNNRKPVKLTKPKYDVQQEGKVTYRFVIEPDGNVSYCKAKPSIYGQLAALGEKTIQNEWKFEKLKGDNAQKQTVEVTITYKLKN